MTLDAYGRYVGRHVRFADMPPGFAPGDPDRPANKLNGLLDDPDGDGERYDRPIVPTPRAGRSVPWSGDPSLPVRT